jgi:hypothetical protein
MSTKNEVVDKTMYAVNAMQPNGRNVKAYINTVGIESEDFSGYLTEVMPRMKPHQEAVVRSLGGIATGIAGLGHTTLIFSHQTAKNLFPDPENVEVINGATIGQAIVDIFYAERNDIPY